MTIKDSTNITAKNNFVYFDTQARGFEVVRKLGNNNKEIETSINKITVLSD
jgi:hypothetical protein